MAAKRCENCGIDFNGRSSRKFCSRACGAAVQSVSFRGSGSARFKGGPPHYVCQRCGADFTSYVADRIYCGRACMTLAYRDRFAGIDNPAWRGGKWPYKGRSWSAISREVIERDGHCADCGTEDGLIAHHLVPQRFWLSLDVSNDMRNLLALCQSCHAKRPEHYWLDVPDSVFDPAVHSRRPMPRTTTKIVPKPACEVCGKPVTWAKNRFCSYACSNRSRWRNGTYKARVDAILAAHSKVCPGCGKSFNKSMNLYCSRDCYLAAPTGAPGKGKQRL